MAATTDVITLRCPECRVPIPVEQGPRCPTHDLYGLDAATLTHLVDHPLLGQVLDEKYALVGVLGRGGTGSVYRGLQEPLGRPVGVKLLHSAFLAGREGRERFEREARALASLTSLHTVRLLDYGITRQGPAALRNIAYLVMELLEGEDLEARLARGPLAPVDVLAVLDALADSLDEAHAAGIVHRDLKPSNVVLTRRRDGREVPKLIDFGIARMEGGSLTEQGRVSGTPFFMAPEQARGDEAQGTAADVYGAGALCFTLLTGRVPFSGPNAAAIMMAHVRDAVPPLDPSGTDPVLARLEPVIHAAMAKDGAARPASVGGLRDAFAAALGVTGAVTVADAGSASPRPVAPPAPETPVARSWSRAPWVWGAAVAALALTAVFAIATRPSPPPEAAFGVVQPAVPASAAPTVAPPPPTEAPGESGLPVSAPPTAGPAPPATAAPRPRPPRPSPTPGGSRSFRLTEDAEATVALPAGRWRVTATTETTGSDPFTLAFPKGTCPSRDKPGVKRYAETCTLSAPTSLRLANPINFFGETSQVRVTWDPAN